MELSGLKNNISVANSLSRLENCNYVKRIFSDPNKKIREQIIPLVSYGVSSNNDRGVSSNDEQNKKNNKKNIDTKVSSEKILNSQIHEVMDLFYKRINPTLSWGNKTYRKAAAELIEMFGLESTLKMANIIIDNQGPYIPVVTNPWEMKEKLAKFKIQIQNNEELKSKNFIL
jgi:hypothetical protein